MRAMKLCRIIPAAMALALAFCGGCGKAEEPASSGSSTIQESSTEETAQAAESTAEPEEEPAAASSAEEEQAESSAEETAASSSGADTSAVASSEDYIPQDAVGDEDMVAVYPDELVDGTSEVEVDSSSSMFRVVHCEVTVADGKMTADLTMSGKGYVYLYPGTAEEAAADEEANFYGYEEDEEGTYVHRGLPVEALNKELSVAAFSKRKEKWYDRTLVFLADSLPAEAYAGA